MFTFSRNFSISIFSQISYGLKEVPDIFFRCISKYLFNELSDMKCIVYPSQADYLTFRLPQSKAGCMIQEELLKHGILIRSCGSYHNMPADCYRIAVKQHADNEVLINNMRQILEV